MNTLLKMPSTLERILVKLETGQFVINLGGDIGISHRLGVDVYRVSRSCRLLSVRSRSVLSILSLGLAAFLGLRLFFRW